MEEREGNEERKAIGRKDSGKKGKEKGRERRMEGKEGGSLCTL